LPPPNQSQWQRAGQTFTCILVNPKPFKESHGPRQGLYHCVIALGVSCYNFEYTTSSQELPNCQFHIAKSSTPYLQCYIANFPIDFIFRAGQMLFKLLSLLATQCSNLLFKCVFVLFSLGRGRGGVRQEGATISNLSFYVIYQLNYLLA
jgi:hypothetical protein